MPDDSPSTAVLAERIKALGDIVSARFECQKEQLSAYPTKAEINERVAKLEGSEKTQVGRETGRTGVWLWVVAACGVLFGLIMTAVAVVSLVIQFRGP